MTASSQTEPRHLHLVDRLRGQYHLPVNDGAGPLNGSMTFSREFPTPPIQKEAADTIEQLIALVKQFADALGHDETLQGGEAVGLTDRARINGPALNAALIEAKALISKVEAPAA